MHCTHGCALCSTEISVRLAYGDTPTQDPRRASPAAGRTPESGQHLACSNRECGWHAYIGPAAGEARRGSAFTRSVASGGMMRGGRVTRIHVPWWCQRHNFTSFFFLARGEKERATRVSSTTRKEIGSVAIWTLECSTMFHSCEDIKSMQVFSSE